MVMEDKGLAKGESCGFDQELPPLGTVALKDSTLLYNHPLICISNILY